MQEYNWSGRVDEVLQRVFIVQSPVFELLASMFRLQCHDQLPPPTDAAPLAGMDIDLWVDRVRGSLPTAAKHQLQLFFHYESFIGLTRVQWAWRSGSWCRVDDFMERLAAMPPREFLAGSLQTGYTDPANPPPSLEPADLRRYLEASALPAAEQWKLAFLSLDPGRTLEDFLALVETCHAHYFMQEAERLAGAQAAAAQELSGLRHRRDIVARFPEVRGVPVDDLATTVVLAPSVFYQGASTASYDDQARQLLLLFGTRHRAPASDADDAVEAVKLLADDTRLKIVKVLAAGPCYGYELAQRLNLSSSTISHHLSLLASRHVVVAAREDNRVAYTLNRERLAALLASFGEELLG